MHARTHTFHVTFNMLLQISFSSKLNGRFGTGLALVDINADGLNDLAVSAPSVGSDIHEYYVSDISV